MIGIQFEEVTTRGSQWRVESFMLRMTRAKGFVCASPLPDDVKSMRAATAFAYIQEPESGFHTDPILVLDFQSLYPSIMIGYNYCYSTCLGATSIEDRVIQNRPWFGAGYYKPQPGDLAALADVNAVNVSPSGAMFCDTRKQEGVLPQMLKELLKTRQMVKRSMKRERKRVGGSPSRVRLLDCRQLVLKLVANVTYGYVSASFSGRMPCVDIADAIVSKGRETLSRSMTEAEDYLASIGHADAKVLYGDTDSMFIRIPGITHARAFELGDTLAAEITKRNPVPIKLKFEKIYTKSILETKKRYVGECYEEKDQVEPTFDAKGIETIRRDTVRIEQKILERAIKILFRTQDISQVKKYVQEQFQRMLSEQGEIAGASNITDYTFAAKFRGENGYRTPVNPIKKLADEMKGLDPLSLPLLGERVEYVIVADNPTARYIDRVRAPQMLVNDEALRIDCDYYIMKRIITSLVRCAFSDKSLHSRMPLDPTSARFKLVCMRVSNGIPLGHPLFLPVGPVHSVQTLKDRAFKPMGVSTEPWYRQLNALAKPAIKRPFKTGGSRDGAIGYSKQPTISQTFVRTACVICGEDSGYGKTPLCIGCKQNPSTTSILAAMKVQVLERHNNRLVKLCSACAVLSLSLFVSLACSLPHPPLSFHRTDQPGTSSI
jgi:DNA polymerase zeta